MSLQTRITDLAVAIATDYKQLRTWITGSATGDLTSLTTTAKGSIVEAINEVKVNATGAPPSATETLAGVIEIATQTEVNTGTDTTRAVVPATLQSRLAAFAQPLNSNLTALASLAGQTTYGRSFLTLANQAGLTALLPTSSDTVSGLSRNATQAEVNAGTENVAAVTSLKLHTKLVAYAQPLAANLTTLAGVASGTFGRTLLGASSAAAAKTSLGLATVATSGLASDLTGTLNTAQLPALAIQETYVAASQAAMLALTAQRGDIAIREDQGGKMYLLTSDTPATLADWKPIVANGDVASVNGKVGTVTINKSDVGLGNVDNTSDANKPVSTAQSTALNLRLLKTDNLSDLANVGTARSNLSVYSKAEIGDPETDFAAAYAAAKV